MPRPQNPAALPTHPAVDTVNIISARVGGHTGPCAKVTCPHCDKSRLVAVRTLRHQVAKPAFTGSCRPCWTSLPKSRKFRTGRNPSGRRMLASGYIALGKNAIADEDLEMFDAMRGSGGYVLEHRWVMAKHLGRALRSDELVDHKHGQKDQNDIDDLRLYVRGKQQPGSACGHGTYYHEWQMAERELRLLRR